MVTLTAEICSFLKLYSMSCVGNSHLLIRSWRLCPDVHLCTLSELCWSADPAGGVTKSVGSLSAEQNGGHAQPGRVGHEREAVLRWDRDQGLGCGLLCSTETMSGGSTQVSYELMMRGSCTMTSITLKLRRGNGAALSPLVQKEAPSSSGHTATIRILSEGSES